MSPNVIDKQRKVIIFNYFLSVNLRIALRFIHDNLKSMQDT